MRKRFERYVRQIAAIPGPSDTPSLCQLVTVSKQLVASLVLLPQMVDKGVSDKGMIERTMGSARNCIHQLAKHSGKQDELLRVLQRIYDAVWAILQGNKPVVGPADILERALSEVPHLKQSYGERNALHHARVGEMTKTTPKNYGLSVETPVLVPGGIASGAANEKKYLSRLRCPNGNSVEFARRGSVNPRIKAAMEAGAGTMEAMLAEANRASRAGDFSALLSASGTPVDVYDVDCTCGEHEATVYMNMYEGGPDEPVDLPGWTLAD